MLFIATTAFSQAPETFVHTTDEDNSSNNTTVVSNGTMDAKPNGIFLFTHNYSAPGTVGSRHDLKVGWYYTGTKWYLYNEDKTAMDTGIGFNVLIPGIGMSSWIVTADSNTNMTGNTVTIDHPKINGDTSARLFINSVWNLNGSFKGVYNTNTIGVYYNVVSKKWCIFFQDVTQKMIHGSSYNIILLDKSSDVTNFIQIATPGNTQSYTTLIDHPEANGNPDAHIFITPIWNPDKKLWGTYNNHETGVYYNNGKWAIFNEDLVKMDSGVSFNVMIIPNNNPTKLTLSEMNQDIHLFPNPVRIGDKLELNITHPYTGTFEMDILDMTGKVCKSNVFEKPNPEWSEQILVGDLPKGIYIMRLYCNGFISMQKFVIE